MLSWLASAHTVTDEMEEAWRTVCHIKTEVAKMIDHDNDGVRTLAVKFYEMLIIAQTYAEADSMSKKDEFSLDAVPLSLKVSLCFLSS